ncbi:MULTISPECIES: hypothetical protein [Pseudomonas]|uniref:Uncharacterized protein n=1 Tax=Pseudomonas khavaziana TaxID=2842351 RepID=A0ABZ2DJ82_9PSED|nr:MULTISPECIES: hypothetical protein [Pseudomonas fluorescens group]AZE59142.1 hypothetical protein C4K02_0757 [Pseudomonas synxantha]
MVCKIVIRAPVRRYFQAHQIAHETIVSVVGLVGTSVPWHFLT